MALGTAAILGAAGIGAASNFIGNLFGKKSNDNANQTNMQIAQMNNEWSEKMMEKQNMYNIAQWQREADFSKAQQEYQNQWNLEQWNRENEYNSASAQAQRLKQAGLNPALVMGGNNAGSAASVSSAGASTPSGNSVGLPSPSSARVSPYQFDFNAIGSALTSATQQLVAKDMNDAQIRLLDKQTQWYDQKAQNELAETIERTSNWKLKNEGQKLQNNWIDNLNASEYYKNLRQGMSHEANALMNLKQSLLLDKDIASYDVRLQGGLSEQLSRIALNYANRDLSLQQADSALQDVWNKIEQRIGMKIDNDIKAHTRDVTIQRAHQARNLYDLGFDGLNGLGKAASEVSDWFEKNIINKSKRYWKDTKRAFGIK